MCDGNGAVQYSNQNHNIAFPPQPSCGRWASFQSVAHPTVFSPIFAIQMYSCFLDVKKAFTSIWHKDSLTDDWRVYDEEHMIQLQQCIKIENVQLKLVTQQLVILNSAVL